MPRRIRDENPDALELLMCLSTTPACTVTLMDELGWGADRFGEAIDAIRTEHAIRIHAPDYRETIWIVPRDFKRATKIAERYANRHVFN